MTDRPHFTSFPGEPTDPGELVDPAVYRHLSRNQVARAVFVDEGQAQLVLPDGSELPVLPSASDPSGIVDRYDVQQEIGRLVASKAVTLLSRSVRLEVKHLDGSIGHYVVHRRNGQPDVRALDGEPVYDGPAPPPGSPRAEAFSGLDTDGNDSWSQGRPRVRRVVPPPPAVKPAKARRPRPKLGARGRVAVAMTSAGLALAAALAGSLVGADGQSDSPEPVAQTQQPRAAAAVLSAARLRAADEAARRRSAEADASAKRAAAKKAAETKTAQRRAQRRAAARRAASKRKQATPAAASSPSAAATSAAAASTQPTATTGAAVTRTYAAPKPVTPAPVAPVTPSKPVQPADSGCFPGDPGC